LYFVNIHIIKYLKAKFLEFLQNFGETWSVAGFHRPAFFDYLCDSVIDVGGQWWPNPFHDLAHDPGS
jgi:hypothetical protein